MVLGVPDGVFNIVSINPFSGVLGWGEFIDLVE